MSNIFKSIQRYLVGDNCEVSEPNVVEQKLTMQDDFASAAKPYCNQPELRHNSNCYTYALGIPEHGKATPGKLIHNKTRLGESMSCSEMKLQTIYNALLRDGLKPIARPEYAPYEDAPVIAAFLAQEYDYHFYRLHKDGTWSHQGGRGGPISQRDENGGIIEDLFYADRGVYKDFIGYFTIPETGLRYVIPSGS
jgi:hypothetical protein|tara:strand:+ start:104802 stop:105383 length:582 start_codon:yes stop_codon:yes gene_type:complete